MIRAYGKKEVAKWCDVVPSAVNNWVNRYSDYPKPVSEIVSGNVVFQGWSLEQKEEWLRWMKGIS